MALLRHDLGVANTYPAVVRLRLSKSSSVERSARIANFSGSRARSRATSLRSWLAAAVAVIAAATVATGVMSTSTKSSQLQLSPPTREQVLREQSALVKRASDAVEAEERMHARRDKWAYVLIALVLFGCWRLWQPAGRLERVAVDAPSTAVANDLSGGQKPSLDSGR